MIPNRKKHQYRLGVWIMILIIIVLLVILVRMFNGNATEEENANKIEEENGNGNVIQNDEELQEPENSLIYESEEIVIYSLFQSSVMNPDAGMEMGEDVASIEAENVSGQHIEMCEIEISATDGEVYQFQIEDIPTGKMVLAFDISNREMAENVKVDKVDCTVKLADGDVLMQGQIEFTVQGTLIQLTNIGESDIKNLTVNCHCVLDGEYFGGKKYEYGGIDILPGEMVEIDAIDCYLGETEVSSLAVR